MFPKGKGTPVPSDGQAREKLALYVYEYLLHIGAQKSAQTFLSEIRWEKNITLGEPPGFLHSWWCVFWDLYCAAPERRETCDHSSEAKAFHDYSAAAAPSPVMGGMPPGEGMPGGPMPPGFFQRSPHSTWQPGKLNSPHLMHFSVTFVLMLNNTTSSLQPPGGGPGPHPMLPNMDPTRPQGHPNLGPMQRMSGPRGMGPMGPGPQNFGGGMRPPHNNMGPGMPGVNMGPGTGRPWPNPNNANSVSINAYTLGSAGSDCSPFSESSGDSNNSGDNLYTMINTGPGNRNNFPMGPGSDGPLGAMAGMEPHHMNGSLGNTSLDNSPNNLSGISNPPGTPRDDGDISGNFLHSFQSENYSPTMTMSV
uniref:Single stranded DNA binding protein 3b n=1 Tax=Neogobius melanostomus TaxID=47308 RepID=A0A8C6UFS8_9GOBI